MPRSSYESHRYFLFKGSDLNLQSFTANSKKLPHWVWVEEKVVFHASLDDFVRNCVQNISAVCTMTITFESSLLIPTSTQPSSHKFINVRVSN